MQKRRCRRLLSLSRNRSVIICKMTLAGKLLRTSRDTRKEKTKKDLDVCALKQAKQRMIFAFYVQRLSCYIIFYFWRRLFLGGGFLFALEVWETHTKCHW